MKRSAALHYPEGTTRVGTARVREDRTVGPDFASRELMRRTGQQPNSEFDDIASGYDPFGEVPKVPAVKKKPAKYRNAKCEIGGIKFDSKREMKRWHELVQMQARGEIAELELQVPFVLAEPVVIAGRKRPALRYVADFVYEKGGETVIEDVKGRVTEGYRIKRHLMAARGLTIVEIK
ncbi:DUF1064 domain-containing protein [Caballeronia sp. LZ062]|uniref:DUF1064 domain-containing protein n=1 Tax=unclassified Caballeronia TaxID=2646786 RepID=UPI00285D7DDC|nr:MULTISPECIES: DUF1064 domain-containing protein [unclassified Caballeronia]MDR5856627.1 DUF1064 domain-containing protein [Caballeronia sp. LZ050]MDR5868787.1 DUF1064 domain-containing protein [Caballeronia sp. LZ062]